TIFQQMEKQQYYTKYRGHAEELVLQLLNQYDPHHLIAIVIVGGDGTVHEVMNGLGNIRIPVAYIPGGSGNDFARGNDLRKQPEQILEEVYRNQRTTPYWLGEFQINGKDSRAFVNSIGVGFDAAVSKLANQSPFKKICNQLRLGKLVYIISLLQALFTFRPRAITVHVDGCTHRFQKCLFISINNQPYFGGGMKINPEAINNGDLFSLLVIDSISKWKVLTLFGTVFTGRHLSFKEVHVLKGKDIIITSETLQPFHADGETTEVYDVAVSKYSQPIKVFGSSHEWQCHPHTDSSKKSSVQHD